MSRQRSSQRQKYLKTNPDCDPRKEINILLLGPTGVGKSTFINAFANYIVSGAFEDAGNDGMQVVIPSSFSQTNPDTFEDTTIYIGQEDDHEKFSKNGASSTRYCRSFVFPIGDRNLRFIDTPGIVDTRGIEQDAKNFQEILNFIAQYEHLNSICILFKSKEDRLTVAFRFAVNELLRHLHVEARHNIAFIFTNARATFYTPGCSKTLLDGMLETYRKTNNIDLSISKKNSFLFDNEAFRFLALRKNGFQIEQDEILSYKKSWDKSVGEYARLMKHILTCPLHDIQNMLSLNAAVQLIRKLPRPIAETAKAISENIQLVNEHKGRVLRNPSVASAGIPQNQAVVEKLDNPLTVCCTKNGCPRRNMIHNRTAEGLSICHDNCFLDGVQQETLSDPRLQDCEVMELNTGMCETCGCHWTKHKHITYDLKMKRTHIRLNPKNQSANVNDIDQYRRDLERESQQIQDVYKQLAQFLQENALLSTNDAYVEYLQYFIREEKTNANDTTESRNAIAHLEQIMTDYLRDMERFKQALEDNKNVETERKSLRINDVFRLVEELYVLPINGKQIREQVEEIKIKRDLTNRKNEIFVEVPIKAESSTIMLQLQDAVSKS